MLKLDIRRYFPSIDHLILKSQLNRQIKDRSLRNLLELIIHASPDTAGLAIHFPGDDLLTHLERRRGIPIGNLTSQIFANLYLNEFDHWLVEQQTQEPAFRESQQQPGISSRPVRPMQTVPSPPFPEPTYPWICRERHAGVHEPASGL